MKHQPIGAYTHFLWEYNEECRFSGLLSFPISAFKLISYDKEPIVFSVPVIIGSHNSTKRSRKNPTGMRRTAKILEIFL